MDFEIGAENFATLSHVDDFDVAMESRYIVTGFKELPSNDAFSLAAHQLDEKVSKALSEQGLQVRSESFEKPLPAAAIELEADTTRVLRYLFNDADATFRKMGADLQMQANVLQYHLDQLDEADLATCGGGNCVSGEAFWVLTNNGRRHVLHNKLLG